jgi:F-box protein 9
MLESIARHQGDIKSHADSRSLTLRKSVLVQPQNVNLINIIRTFPKDLTFEPENEKEPVLLNKLPEELLVLIISKLDFTSVERFATLSRKARLVSLDAGIWRHVFSSETHVVH